MLTTGYTYVNTGEAAVGIYTDIYIPLWYTPYAVSILLLIASLQLCINLPIVCFIYLFKFYSLCLLPARLCQA